MTTDDHSPRRATASIDRRTLGTGAFSIWLDISGRNCARMRGRDATTPPGPI